jgi:hypothetical protein
MYVQICLRASVTFLFRCKALEGTLQIEIFLLLCGPPYYHPKDRVKIRVSYRFLPTAPLLILFVKLVCEHVCSSTAETPAAVSFVCYQNEMQAALK